jgi:hypothetical protein
MPKIVSQTTAKTHVPRYYNPRLDCNSGLTLERIRQVEYFAMRKFRRELAERALGQSDLL